MPRKLSIVLLISVFILNSAKADDDLLLSEIDKETIQKSTQSKLPSIVNVEIIADEVNYNQEKNYYEALGKAEAVLKSKDVKLEADKISYDAEVNLLEAFGDIKVVQTDSLGNENIVYGSYVSYKTDTKSYELDDPKLFAQGVKLKARSLKSTYVKGKKKKNDLIFKEGVAAFDQPISVYTQGSRVTTRYSREIKKYNSRRQVNWNDLADKSSMRYSAEEVYFDNTKKTNNLRIRGARIWINDKLSIPSPVAITTTVGDAANTKFKGPIIGTRERIGGFALGPRFFYGKDHGTYSFVPLVQMGNGPEFGVGAIGSFNTPGDKTFLMGGYGSLNDRYIVNAHQEFGNHFEINGLVNQFVRNRVFGSSQVGQLYEGVTDFRMKLPFIDERGMLFRLTGGWAKDNLELFSDERRTQLLAEQDGKKSIEHEGFRSELESEFYTKPVWRRGNELYNYSLRGRGQGAFRFYDTGDTLAIARFGPALEARMDNLAFEVAYLFAAINGESPFVFDQFVDGSQSVIFDGDYKVNKWFSFGTLLTYSIENSQFTRNQVRTEFGPQDFKLRLSYDTIRNQIAIGFNVLFGDPLQFDSMRVRI